MEPRNGDWQMSGYLSCHCVMIYPYSVLRERPTPRTSMLRAGAEWAFSLLASAMAGTNLIHDVGYAESGLTGSLQSLAICNDIIGMTQAVYRRLRSERRIAGDRCSQTGRAGGPFHGAGPHPATDSERISGIPHCLTGTGLTTGRDMVQKMSYRWQPSGVEELLS